MTTIYYDGKTLYADRRTTISSGTPGTRTKTQRTKDFTNKVVDISHLNAFIGTSKVVAFAGAGNITLIEKMAIRLLEGRDRRDLRKIIDSEFGYQLSPMSVTMVFLTEEGGCYLLALEKNHYTFKAVTEPEVFGSGKNGWFLVEALQAINIKLTIGDIFQIISKIDPATTNDYTGFNQKRKTVTNFKAISEERKKELGLLIADLFST